MGNKVHTCPSITTGPQYGKNLSSCKYKGAKSILTITNTGANHLVGSLTFHTLTIFLCGAFTALALLLSGILLVLHATHFSNPGQQIQ